MTTPHTRSPMTTAATWLLALLLALCIIALIAYARGPKHHHGDEIGTHGTKIIIVTPPR